MAALTLSRALPLSHLVTEGLNAATSDKRIEVINTLFRAWNESKNSQITKALQERVTLEKDPTCLQVQSTADLRLTEEERRLIHFTLGETLYLYTQEDDLPSVITQMVSHINMAQFGTNWHLITSADPNAHFLEKEEQIQLAHFNGQAAQQVYEEGDFNAAGHFAQIALILYPTIWKKDHALAVQLHTILSQYHFLNRRLNDGITLSSKLLKEAKNDTDRLAAFKLQAEGFAAVKFLEENSCYKELLAS